MEKKNNSLIIIILVIIILGLVGYIVYDKVLSKGIDKKDGTVIEEKSNSDELINNENNNNKNNDNGNKLLENNNKYGSIIDEYSRAMRDENYSDNVDNETKYPYINDRMMNYYHNYLEGYYDGQMFFKYVYYDINKDGKDEMIVVTDTQYRQVNTTINSIAEIYTYDNKPIRFFNSYCLGERCSAKIWDNGIIYFEGSGGAAYHSYEFYKIGLDGYTKESVKKYDVEYKDSDDKIFTVTDRDTNKTVDFKSIDDIINSVKGDAKDVDLSKLDWKEIK